MAPAPAAAYGCRMEVLAMRSRRLFALFALPLLAAPAAAADRTWFGGSGDWSVGANWLPAGVPGLDDRALLNAGTATLGSDATVAGFVLGGGTLAGTGTLTASGASSWSAGSVSGTGAVDFGGDLAISGTATKVIVGGRTVNLLGTTLWSGNTANHNNAIRFWNGATLNNLGTFDDANPFASFIEHNVGGPHLFHNQGTYNKLAATVTTIDIGVAFDNSGTVNVQAGTFRPAGGTSSGTFNIAAGAVLDFREGANVLNQVTTAGAGTLMISSDNVGADATVSVNGGTHTSALVLSGSTLAGSDHSFEAAATWSGGSISGAARTSFLNDVTISGAATKVIVGGRSVDLHGTTTWSGNTGANNNAIRFWNGATLTNLGTFNDANAFASFIEHNTGGPHVFRNQGVYNKLAATITTVDLGVAFDNTGTVNVQAGTLRPSGGTSSGTFNIAAGAVLDFRNGTNVLNGATTAGAGTLMISSDNVGADATVAIHGGTHTAALVLAGSSLGGSDHAFQGAATWTGGSLSGAARTSFLSDVAISGAATKVIVGGRIVDLHGTTTWSGNTGANNNAIRFWNGATINNLGTFVDANGFASFIEHNTGGPHVFANAGTYRKTQATVTTVDLGVTFANTGLVDIQAGTLQTMSALTNAGTIRVAAGAVLHGNATDFQNAGVITGDGTVSTHANGDVVNRGRLRPGDTIGTLAITGDLLQQAAGSLDIDLGGVAGHDVLAVSDDVTLGGTLQLFDAGYAPVVGDSFVVLTFDQRLAGSSFGSVAWSGFGAGVSFDAIYNPHDVTVVVTSVPEPATWAMWLGGALALRAFSPTSRRRRSTT
jgi:hypothetical protein